MSAMLDHVSITVPDLADAAPFWDAAMAALGFPRVWRSADGIGYGERNGPEDDLHSFVSLYERPGAVGGRRHWAFRAADRAAVRAFHAAGLAAGGRCDGRPGLRPACHAAYHGAFLLDPAGNRVEAVCNRPEPGDAAR